MPTPTQSPLSEQDAPRKKTRLNGCGCLDVLQIEIYTPEIKHSWTGLKMYFLSKMGIFHCYVSLPESKKITVLLIR